jgi:uncharacterized protein
LKVGNQYIIPFKGLKEGKHNFQFQIKKKFFEENETLEIPDGLLDVDVILSKKSTFLFLEISIRGEIEMVCDRCLEVFRDTLNYVGQLYVKFKEEPEEPDENVMFLHPNEDSLDLSQYLFDSIGLSIPIQRVHPVNADGEPGCNKDMLSILNEHNSKNTDNEVKDPRWLKLKDLLNDGNKTD